LRAHLLDEAGEELRLGELAVEALDRHGVADVGVRQAKVPDTFLKFRSSVGASPSATPT
jgi:hypothetical protein